MVIGSHLHELISPTYHLAIKGKLQNFRNQHNFPQQIYMNLISTSFCHRGMHRGRGYQREDDDEYRDEQQSPTRTDFSTSSGNKG